MAVKVAIVDSGVNFSHPHLALPPRGVSLLPGGIEDGSGHGTCVAALVHWIAPDADLDAIRVLPADLRVSSELLAEAIERATERGARIVNVSIGTSDGTHRDRIRRACEAAAGAGALVVAAALAGREELLPAGLPGVVAVGPAAPGTLLHHDPASWPPWLAGADPRPAEGLRRNFAGPSFAAARVSGALARLAEEVKVEGAALLDALAVAARTSPSWLR